MEEIALLSTDSRSVEVWDYREGTRRAILPDQMASVYCAALTSDGNRAVVGLTDHRVRIWDVSLAQRELGPPRSQLRCCTVTHDGRYGVAWFEGGDKRIWDLATGSEVLSGNLDRSIEGVITATGQTAISSMTGKRDKRMNILSTGQGVTVLTRRQLKKTGEYEEPDQLEQGSQGYPLWIQQEGAAEPVMLIGHSLPVTAACLSGDGRWVISGSIGRKLRVWDLKSGRQIKILAGHKGTVYSLAASANTGFVVSASEDRTVKLWDLTSSAEVPLATFTGEGRMRSCSIVPDGKTVIAVEQDGRVHILKLEGTELGV
jgi:WD40 repeat protein